MVLMRKPKFVAKKKKAFRRRPAVKKPLVKTIKRVVKAEARRSWRLNMAGRCYSRNACITGGCFTRTIC